MSLSLVSKVRVGFGPEKQRRTAASWRPRPDGPGQGSPTLTSLSPRRLAFFIYVAKFSTYSTPSCRPERYSSTSRAFNSLRLCWAIHSARQWFSKPLKVVSPESFFAFLTRSSLSTTVVLICSPIILRSYGGWTMSRTIYRYFDSGSGRVSDFTRPSLFP